MLLRREIVLGLIVEVPLLWLVPLFVCLVAVVSQVHWVRGCWLARWP